MNTSELWLALQMDCCTKHRVGGVFAIDLLPTNPIPNLPKIFIANTDPHDLPGQHWIGLYIPLDGPAEFFDSLGHHPSFYDTLFEKFLYTHSNEYIYNITPLQSKYSDTCGHFCLFYSIHRCRGVSLQNIVQMFSKNGDTNDKIVREFVKDHLGSVPLERLLPFGNNSYQNCLSPLKYYK